MTNELRGYLNERKELCEDKLNSYNELVSQKEIAEQRYQEACKKVDELGSFDEIVDELNMLNGFLAEVDCVAEAVTDTISDTEMTDIGEITAPELPRFVSDVDGRVTRID